MRFLKNQWREFYKRSKSVLFGHHLLILVAFSLEYTHPFELINGRTFALALLHCRDCDFLS